MELNLTPLDLDSTGTELHLTDLNMGLPYLNTGADLDLDLTDLDLPGHGPDLTDLGFTSLEFWEEKIKRTKSPPDQSRADIYQELQFPTTSSMDSLYQSQQTDTEHC